MKNSSIFLYPCFNTFKTLREACELFIIYVNLFKSDWISPPRKNMPSIKMLNLVNQNLQVPRKCNLKKRRNSLIQLLGNFKWKFDICWLLFCETFITFKSIKNWHCINRIFWLTVSSVWPIFVCVSNVFICSQNIFCLATYPDRCQLSTFLFVQCFESHFRIDFDWQLQQRHLSHMWRGETLQFCTVKKVIFSL